MSWQILTAISVLSLSASVLMQRVLLSKDKLNPFAYVVVFQAIVGLILMVPALINGVSLSGLSDVWLPAAISIVAFGAGHVAYAKTLQLVEASVFSVLFASQAIWIMLLGIFWFNESLSFVQIMGTLLIFASIGLIVKRWSAFRPDKGTLYGLLTGVLFGIAITTWSYVGRYTDALSWAGISFIATALVALVFLPSSRKAIPSLLTRVFIPKLLLLGILYGIGSLTMLYAYKAGSFSEVTPVRQASIIVTTLLALIIFASERNRIKAKIAASIICFTGVLLIISN